MPKSRSRPKKNYAAKKRANKSKARKGVKKQAVRRVAIKARAKTSARVKKTCPLADIDELAEEYAEIVNSSVPWRWDEIQKGLTAGQRSAIRNHAREKGLVKTAPLDPKQDYVQLPQGAPPFVKFPKDKIADTQQLPKSMWLDSDSKQFKWLNEKTKEKYPNYNPKTQTFTGSPKKYTWHHDQDPPGQMQLVEFGMHNSTNHSGGRNVWGGGTDFR